MKTYIAKASRKQKKSIVRIIGLLLCFLLVGSNLPSNLPKVKAKAKRPNPTSTAKITKESTQKMNVKENYLIFMHPNEKLKFTAGGSATWSSTNPKVAKVTKSGVVYIPSNSTKGSCFIVAKVKGRTYKCRVVVSEIKIYNSRPYPVDIDEESIHIKRGEFVETEGGYSYSETFHIRKCTSSNDKVAKVYIGSWDDSVEVIPKNPGIVTIKVSLKTETGFYYLLKGQIGVVDEEKEEEEASKQWIKDHKVKLTEEEVQQKILEFSKKYPNDSVWNSDSEYGGVGGCGGFAAMLSNYIYGDPVRLVWQDEKWETEVDYPKSKLACFQTYADGVSLINTKCAFPNGLTCYSNDYDRLKPGDIVFMDCKGLGDMTTHVCIVKRKYYDKSFDEEKVEWAEGNVCGMVSYNRFNIREDLEERNFFVISRN